MPGRRPTGTLIPRFRNIGEDQRSDFRRGYSFSVFASRSRGNVGAGDPPIGATFKEKSAQLGPWTLWMNCMAEHLPYADNRVTLSRDQKDTWGMPLLQIRCTHRENEEAMVKDMLTTASEIAATAGFKGINAWDSKEAIGLGVPSARRSA